VVVVVVVVAGNGWKRNAAEIGIFVIAATAVSWNRSRVDVGRRAVVVLL
jgi:hypothetical protein